MAVSAAIGVSGYYDAPSGKISQFYTLLHGKLLQLSGMLIPALMYINVASRRLAVDSYGEKAVAADFSRVLEVLSSSGAFAGEIEGMLTPKATATQKSLQSQLYEKINMKDAEIAAQKASLAAIAKERDKYDLQLERLQEKLQKAQDANYALESSMKLLYDARNYWKRKFNGLSSSVAAEKHALRASQLDAEVEKPEEEDAKAGSNTIGLQTIEKDSAYTAQKVFYDIALAEKEVNDLHVQLDAYMVLNYGLEQQSERWYEENASLRADSNALEGQKRLKELQEQILSQNQRMIAYNEVLSRQNQKIAYLTAALEAASQKQTEDGQQRQKTEPYELEAAKRQISELLDQAQTVYLVYRELNNAKQQIYVLQNAVSTGEQMIKDLKEQIAKQENSIYRLNGTIGTLTYENAAVRQSAREHISEIQRLKTELDAQLAMVNELSEAADRQNQQFAAVLISQDNTSGKQQAETELALAKIETDKVQAYADNYAKMYKEMLLENMRLNQTAESQATEFEANLERQRRLEAMTADLEHINQHINDYIDIVKSQANTLKKQSAEIDQQIAALDHIRQRVADLAIEFDAAASVYAKVVTAEYYKVRDAQNQIKATSDYIAQLNQQLLNQRAENAAYRQRIENFLASATENSKGNERIAEKIRNSQKALVKSIQKARTELKSVSELSGQFDKLATQFTAFIEYSYAKTPKDSSKNEPEIKWELIPGDLLKQIETLEQYYKHCECKETLSALIVPESHRWYSEKFSPVQMEIYDDMIRGYANFQQFVEVSPHLNTTSEDAFVIHSAALHDYPELFYIGNSVGTTCIYGGPMTKITLFAEPFEGKSRAELVDLQLKLLKYAAKLAEKSRSQGQELHIFFYNYLHEGVQYSKALGDTTEGYSHTYRASGCLYHGKCVCQGISLGWQLLANFGHVWSISISGTAGETKEEAGPHAWNMIQLDGNYYICDFTWNLTTKTFKYMCCNSGFIIASHHPDDKFSYPHCDSTDHFYYKQQGYFIDVASMASEQINEELKKIMKRQILARKNKTKAEIIIFALSLDVMKCKEVIAGLAENSCDELKIAWTNRSGAFSPDLIQITLILKE